MRLMIDRALVRMRKFQSADFCIIVVYSRWEDGSEQIIGKRVSLALAQMDQGNDQTFSGHNSTLRKHSARKLSATNTSPRDGKDVSLS
jgi:hypothetical protein